MRNSLLVLLLVCGFLSCKNKEVKTANSQSEPQQIVNDTLVFVFASCNDQERKQPLWNPIIDHKPELFVWGGDNIYSDTEDMAKMKADYNMQFNQPDYARLRQQTKIIGTWDDHDYGQNDAGVEYVKKQEAQQLFLDFMEFPEDHFLRKQEGIYYSYVHAAAAMSVKFVFLDTRYFRDPLSKSEDPDKRYDPWPAEHEGSLLGPEQWSWLQNELEDDAHDYTFIVSSIQFVNDYHYWEKWGNFPAEMSRMYEVLQNAKAKNIVILSGDRHQAEMSKNDQAGLDYPLLDFTTSGLTHTWPDTPLEESPLRWGEGTKQLNFGLIKIHKPSNTVIFEIRGEDDVLYERFVQTY